MRQERSNGVLHGDPEREAGGFPMRAGLLAVFDQQLIEVGISRDDGHLIDRSGKCHLIRSGAKGDIAAQEFFQRGSTAIAAMNELDAAWQQMAVGKLPADADQRGNPKLDLVPIRKPFNANIGGCQRNVFSVAAYVKGNGFINY